MRVFGTSPKPRGLFYQVSDDTFEAVRRHFAASARIERIEDVRQDEWDALVTSKSVPMQLAGHIYVLALGATYCGRSTETRFDHYVASQLSRVGQAVGRELQMGWALPPALERAVKDDLIPKELRQAQHTTVVWATGTGVLDAEPPKEVAGFLLTGSGGIVAGRFIRRGGQSHCWVLPPYADADLWAGLAVGAWREQDHHRFPRPWNEEADWLTTAEEAAVKEIADVDEARHQSGLAFDVKEAAARERLRDASIRADSGFRRLLTAQGDDLVLAVKAALEQMGFHVRNMDEVLPAGDRREDLRVTSSDAPSWEAIAEVRGYAGGAQQGDLTRLERFAARYEREEKHSPSACWYICNQFIGSHPSDRPVMLSSNPHEVAIFREERALALIDTTQLFKLVKRLEAAAVSETEARARLMSLNDVLA